MNASFWKSTAARGSPSANASIVTSLDTMTTSSDRSATTTPSLRNAWLWGTTVSNNKTVGDRQRPTPKPVSLKRVFDKKEMEYQNLEVEEVLSNNDYSNKSSTTQDLIFEGTVEYQSDLLPMSTKASPKDLLEFFLNTKNRDLVIKGGGNRCEVIPPTQELYDEWAKNSRIVRSTPPNQQCEEILAVSSDVHLAPGLSISAVSYTGCKLLIEPKSALPFYEFTLVKEDYCAKGSRPMVWIFNKVTGKHNNVNNRSDEEIDTNTHEGSSKTYALSRLTLQLDKEHNGCRVCYYGRVKVVSKLSNRMLRILPLPKKTVEATVSKSIVSQLEKEGVKSVENFADALRNWTHDHFPPES